MDEQKEGKSGKKGLVIALAVIVLLAAGGAALWVFVINGKNTSDSPEKIAQDILDASAKKDWKAIIDQTPDEVLEVLLSTNVGLMQKKGLTNVKELRAWAADHASEVPDPMNGKEIREYRVGEVNTMPAADYIELFLGGEGDNAYYTFLKNKEEIAVVKIIYVMADNGGDVERTDSVVEYRKDGTWYPLTGLQVIYSMLLESE